MSSPVAPLPAPGHMGVDYEQRVDFDLFDFYNIRYTTQTWIGGALGDKMTRCALLTRDRGPTLWDFGSAARHHRLHSPWLEQEDCRAGMLGLRGRSRRPLASWSPLSGRPRTCWGRPVSVARPSAWTSSSLRS